MQLDFDICLFILHAFIAVLFSSSWYQGLAAACDCGTPCPFLLTFVGCRNWMTEWMELLFVNEFGYSLDKISNATVFKFK